MSVNIERTTHKSSTISPSCGNTSLTSMPDFPFLENLNGEPIATPFMPGISWPSILVSDGFGSQVSTCDGAPCAKMWTTCFAFAGSGGVLGSSVASASIAWADGANNRSEEHTSEL